jgi:leucyl-tRNA synthetase
MTEEFWKNIGEKPSIHRQTWPKYNAQLIKKEEITIVVQVNGRLRDNIIVASDASEDDIKKRAASSTKVKAFIEGKKILKTIYIPKKLINIVVPQ